MNNNFNNYPSSQNNESYSSDLTDTETGEITIPLLAECLLVKREKKKIGEVIIRKEIQTRIVEVPIRREVLIVEQVGAANFQLAEIDLATPLEKDNLILESQSNYPSNSEYLVQGKYLSAKHANQVLQEIINKIDDNEISQISIAVLVNNSQQQLKVEQIINQVNQADTIIH